jgi:outer membrane protein
MNRPLLTLFLVFFIVSASAQQLLTLPKAMEMAALHSPELKQSLLSVQRSEENLNAEEASTKTQFDLNLDPVSYGISRRYSQDLSLWKTTENLTSMGELSISQPILLTDATIGLTNTFGWQYNYDESRTVNDGVNKFYFNNLALRLDQPLFTANEQKMNLQELELDLENTMISYALQKLSMERSITQGFYSVYQNQMQLLISEAEYENQKMSFEIIKNKVEGGLVAREELYQAEVNLATSQSSLQNAKVDLEDQKDEFRVLVGLGFDYDFNALVNVNSDSVPIDLTMAIDHALTVRRELRQREINIETAQFNLLRTKNADKFSGNLSLKVGLDGDNENFGQVYQSPTTTPNVGLSFKVPIIDWGQRKSKLRAAEITIESEEINLSNERIEIVRAIRALHRSLQNQLIQINISEQNVRNAQLTYDINLERYQNGDLTSMDLQLFQDQLSEKKISQTNAIISYKIELLNMKIQTLYDWETKEDYTPEGLFVIED